MNRDSYATKASRNSIESSRWLLPVFVALLLAIGFGGFGSTTTYAQSSTATYELEIGDALLMPGQSQVLVPVYMTNSVPVTDWSMGLDYDEYLIHAIGVSTIDTASATLGPIINATPSTPPLQYVQVIYSLGPLQPGVDQLVAHLICEVPNPPTTTINVEIDPIESGINGQPVVTQVGGTVTVIVGNALAVGFGSGSVLDDPHPATVHWPTTLPVSAQGYTPVRVPVRMWTNAPVSQITFVIPALQPGLDYDEFLLFVGVDVEGTILDGLTTTITSAPLGHSLYVEINLPNAVIPATNGDTVAWLSIVPDAPLATMMDVHLASGAVRISGSPTPVSNLLAGAVEFSNHFIRGDVTFDASLNLMDVAAIAEYLNGGDAPICLDAADVNDDASIGILDIVDLLSYVFAAQTLPAAPFPKAGADPTEPDGLDCL